MLASWISYTLTNTLIPVLKEQLRNTPLAGKEFATILFLYALIFLVLLSIFGILFKNSIIYFLAPTFSFGNHFEAVRLLQIMILAVVFSGLSGILWGIHNAYEDFAYPSLIGIVYNIIFIFIAVVFHQWLGIEALAYGVLAGNFGRFIIQFIPLIVRKRLTMPKVFWHPGLNKIINAIGPIFASLGVGNLNSIVDRILASGLTSGLLTDMNYASKVGLLPSGLIGNAIATTLYPRIVTYTLDNDNSQIRRIVTEGFGWVLFFSILVMSGFIIYPSAIMAALYRRGAFGIIDLRITYWPILIYGLFAIFYMLSPLLTHIFYARKENVIVFRSSTFAVVVNILGSILMVHPFGISGLILANALSQTIYVILQTTIMLNRLNWNFVFFASSIFWRGAPPGLTFLGGVIISLYVFPYESNNITAIVGFLHLICAVTSGSVCLSFYILISPDNIVSRFVRSALYKVLKIK